MGSISPSPPASLQAAPHGLQHRPQLLLLECPWLWLLPASTPNALWALPWLHGKICSASAYRLQGDVPSPGLYGAFALCLELLLPFSCSDLGACRNASLIYSFSCCCAVLVPFLKSALTEAKPVSPMGSALANSRYFLDLYVGKGAASTLFSQMPLLQHAIPSYKNLAAEAQFRHNSMSVYRIK